MVPPQADRTVARLAPRMVYRILWGLIGRRTRLPFNPLERGDIGIRTVGSSLVGSVTVAGMSAIVHAELLNNCPIMPCNSLFMQN